MFPLVQKEFVQMRRQLMQYLVLLAAAILIFGRFEPSIGIAYATVFPLVLASSMPQISFAYEERENTFAFLRTLPISPAEIVGSKYVFSALVITLFETLLVLVSLLNSQLISDGMWAMVSGTLLAAALLSSVSLLLHFWLGLRSARTALLVIVMALVMPVVALQVSETNLSGTVGSWVTDIVALANSPAGVLMSSGLAAMVMIVSWYISTRIFARRDLSRLV